MAPQTRLKAPGTTLRIVEELVAADRAGVSELAEALDEPVATIHDHLTTLDQLGYINRVGQQYEAGLKFLRVGEGVRRNTEIYEVAKPVLVRLSKSTGKQTSLMVEENGRGVPLLNVETPERVEVLTQEGTPTPLHATAPGKAILANLDEQRIVEIIDRSGPGTSTDPAEEERLHEELKQIQSKGFAMATEPHLEGLQSVAAPVFNREEERVVGAISVFGPERRIDIDGPAREVIKDLHETVNTVEKQL